mmetsp:Transcript_24733/g.39743  ORF Transcript_24733/g.39743 Transcript_24733/m.39743 type:complete len:193 (+) Transcript_24733:101-679(+)|eukprot:jgi/Bigna1/50166/estExt_Genewise1.C_680030
MSGDKVEVRLITIGDSATGKSSLILRYTKGMFQEERKATVGIDLKIKSTTVLGRPTKVRVWDTAGQEQFRTITRNYYRGAQGVLLVYDITNKDSFKHVAKWIKDVENYAEPGVSVVLLGNKCDLEDKRQVTRSEGQAIAQEYEVEFFETSALSGSSVEESFGSLVEKIVAKAPRSSNSGVDLNQKKKSGCCK